MKKLYFAISVLIFIASCSPALLTPSQSDADRAASKWPGTTTEELVQGKTLYEGNCGRCHALKKPTSRNEAGWREIVPPMARKAKIDSKKEEAILKYLITMSSASR